jgi:hypothetical protein
VTTERHPFKAGAAERELGVRWGAAARSERRRGGPGGTWRGVGAAGGKTRVRRHQIERCVGGAWTGEVGAYDAWARGHGIGAAAV